MRYQKIHSQIWTDEKFITLSQDAKYLFLYILTSPHSNSIGLYVLPKPYVLTDLEWDYKRFKKPFDELLNKGLIFYDETVKLVCIRNHLKHNPLENENQAKAIAKLIKSLPKSSLFSTILEQLRERYHQPLREQLWELIPKPETETETKEQTEKEVFRHAKVTPQENIIPPKREWVEAYCKERKNNVSVQTFFDHYMTNGWRVGKAGLPMKNWQAAIRNTWERNGRADLFPSNRIKDDMDAKIEEILHGS